MESNICVISLEAIDLNFLKTSYRPNFENNLPLWNKRNLEFNNNYYEFEIRKEENFENYEDQTKHNNIEYIHCHICEIQVPHNYFNDHKNSVKHKINTKIANLAVQRLQKYINYQKEFSNDKLKSCMYFCPVCVAVMDCRDKNNHEQSVGHKNSAIVEKFLFDFLSLYANDVLVDDHTSKCNILDPNNCPTQMDYAPEKLIATDKSENSFNEMFSVAQNSINANVKEVLDLEGYVNLLKDKYEMTKMCIKVVDNNNLEIETVDGSVVKVSYQSYHGFREVGTRFIKCNLCDEVFETTETQEHIMSNNHLRLVSLPLKDKHCIRQLNTPWSHCVLCNLLVENSDVHQLFNQDHNVNLNQFLISDKIDENALTNAVHHNTDTLIYDGMQKDLLMNSVNESTSKNVSEHKNVSDNKNIDNLATNLTCENKNVDNLSTNLSCENKNVDNLLTNLAISTGRDKNLNQNSLNNQSQEIQNNQKKHFCGYCNVFISTNKNLKKHMITTKHLFNLKSNIHYLMKESDAPEQLCCRVCEENINDTMMHVKNHVTSAEHLEKYKTLLISNTVKQHSADKFFCVMCNAFILAKNEIFHINSKDHKMFHESQNKDSNCNQDVPLSPNPQILKTNDGKCEDKTTEVVNFYFCEICNVNVPNSKQNIEIHNAGRSHIRKINQIPSKEITTVKKENNLVKEDNSDCKTIKNIEPCDEIKPAIKKELYYNLVKLELVGAVKCLVCDVSLTNNEINIMTHITGLKHVKNYNFITKDNKLEINGNEIYCAVCSTYISIGNEISHCQGKRHLKNMTTNKNES